MTDKRVEAISNAVLRDLTDRRGFRQAWDDCDDEIKQEIREATGRAAISADPVTEDVKRLVECLTKTNKLYNYLVMTAEDGESFGSGVLQQHYIMIEAAQNELKKWSGE